MGSLWESERIFAEVADGDIGRLLPEPGREMLKSMPREELRRAVGLGLQRPQPGDILAAGDLPIREVELPAADPQWWLFYRVEG